MPVPPAEDVRQEALLRQGLWQGPYHPTWPPKEGDWVMWVMPEFVKRGFVDRCEGISMMVWFEAHPHPTIIPDAYQYWDPYAELYRRVDGGIKPHTICPIAEPEHRVMGPPETVRDDDEWITVQQAAALLGTTMKDVRRQLRAGILRGRKDGAWVVERASLT